MSRRPDVWVARHGETEWSKAGRHTGLSDVELTPAGEAAAGEIRQRLQAQWHDLAHDQALGQSHEQAHGQSGDRSFDRVLTSPLRRARRTAELAGFGDLAEVDKDLVEWNYGEHEGRRTVDIRLTVPDWSIWSHGSAEGESLEDVSARADRVIAGLVATDGRVLVFSHGHFLRVLAARWATLAPEAGQHLVLDTARLGVLSWYREVPVLRHWNT